MGIRNGQVKPYLTFAKGIDNTSPFGDARTVGTLSEALNADLVSNVLVKKRNGYTSIANWGTNKIRQGFEYVKEDGNREVLVFGHAATTTGTSGILAKMAGSGTPTNITTGLSDLVKPSLLQFGTRAFFFNGTDDFLYDGTSVRQIGITAPTNAPTFNAFVAGSLNTSSSYLYTYTYYNTTTGAESSPAPFSAPISTGVNTGITINVTAGDSSTADKIVIYRSVGGGIELQFEAEISIASTTYNSTVADSALGDILEQDNTRPPLASYAVKLDNRIFIAGFSANPNRVQYSKIGLTGPMPESFQVQDFVDCNPDDGDQIRGLGVVNSTVIVFKEKSYGKLIRIESSFGGLEIEGSSKYFYQEISKNITFLNKSLIASLDSILFWVGFDDIYSTDGTSTTSQGLRIQRTLKQVNLSQAENFTSISKVDTKQFIFSVALGADTEPNFQIVGHYDTFPDIGWTFYSKGADESIHPGIPCGSLFAVTVVATARQLYYFGSTDGSGNIYQLDSGTSDNGYGIYFKVQLPWELHKTFVHDKVFYGIEMLVAGASDQHFLTHTYQSNGVDTDIVTRTTAVASSSSGWDYVNWGAFNWGVIGFKPTKFLPRRRAKMGRFGFSNTNVDEPVAIYNIATIFQQGARA